MANESRWRLLAEQPDDVVWKHLVDQLPLGHDWNPILQGEMLPRAHRLLKDRARVLQMELGTIPAEAKGEAGVRRREIIAEVKLIHPRLERANYLMRGYRVVREIEITRDVTHRRYLMLRKLIEMVAQHRQIVGDQPRPCDLVLWEVLDETWPTDAPATAPTLQEMAEVWAEKNAGLPDDPPAES